MTSTSPPSGPVDDRFDRTEPLPSCAVIGCGVIGAGWAARMALGGCDVTIADPSPDAAAVAERVLAQAVTAHDALGFDTSQIGDVAHASDVAAAVSEAGLIQESVPERLDLKRAVLAEIEAAAPPDALVASSTSGLLPTELQAQMRHPERLLVAHPYNPVYLLPVVELVGGTETTDETVERARAVYSALGMEPVHVRVEIDAFVGDRLLEALWREALWLVADGVATTEEIDRIITHGFGLRWAQMGLFETYRVAGGEGGFRHFMEQFGPALEWPWSKLTDTPEFNDDLVDRIVEQSDAHSGSYSVAELESIRDQNLVAILAALEAQNWGAGQTLARHRRDRSDTL